METRWIGVHVSLAANLPAIKNLSPTTWLHRTCEIRWYVVCDARIKKDSLNNDKRGLRTHYCLSRVFCHVPPSIVITVSERSRILWTKGALSHRTVQTASWIIIRARDSCKRFVYNFIRLLGVVIIIMQRI